MFVYEMRWGGGVGETWRFREITAFMRVFYCTSAVLDLPRKSNCGKRMKQSVFPLINHKVAGHIKINLRPPFFFLPTAVVANDDSKAHWHFPYQPWCLLPSSFYQFLWLQTNNFRAVARTWRKAFWQMKHFNTNKNLTQKNQQNYNQSHEAVWTE